MCKGGKKPCYFHLVATLIAQALDGYYRAVGTSGIDHVPLQYALQ